MVEVGRSHSGRLDLLYRVTGDVAALRLPPVTASVRADDLWQHSCFEAFIRPGEGEAYHEFNFAPSTEWAAYSFAGYRDGRTDAPIVPPEIEVGTADGFVLRASLTLPNLEGAAWYLNVTAVIEQKDGTKSYWALAHPPGDPDFHNGDCFALALPPAS
jgi:hypothetical protein